MPSTSAAATEALTQWAYNRLLRLTLDEVYQDSPDLRPSPDRVRELADRARQAAALRFMSAHEVSAADAIVAATAVNRPSSAVVTSDPADIQALLAAADRDVPVIAV